jgi:hypothetical protein
MTFKSTATALVFAGAVSGLLIYAQETRVPDTANLQRMAARFAPTDIGADLSTLSDADRRVLAKLVEASKIIDALFLRQVWSGNEAMLLDLVRDQSPIGRARRHYFLINKGPWSRLDHNEVFVPGAPPKPAPANYYPAGASKADVERWIQSLPEPDRGRATGFFTVIRRAGDSFSLVPYSIEYQAELALAAARLGATGFFHSERLARFFRQLGHNQVVGFADQCGQFRRRGSAAGAADCWGCGSAAQTGHLPGVGRHAKADHR